MLSPGAHRAHGKIPTCRDWWALPESPTQPRERRSSQEDCMVSRSPKAQPCFRRWIKPRQPLPAPDSSQNSRPSPVHRPSPTSGPLTLLFSGLLQGRRLIGKTILFFFFFLVLGFELRAYTLSHSTSPFL
jgi:hypothetical protein